MAKPWENYAPPAEEEQQQEEGPWGKYGPPGERTVMEGVQQNVGMFEVMGESTARGVFDNTMNAPNAVGEVLGQSLAYPTAAIDRMLEFPRRALAFDLATGDPLPHESFHQKLANARNTWPMSTMIRGYDAPTSVDVQAGLTSMFRGMQPVGVPGQLYTPPQREIRPENNFINLRDQILESYMQRSEEFPVGAAAGDVLSDVLTVSAGRAPFVNAARQRRIANRGGPTRIERDITMDPNFKRWAAKKGDDLSDWFKNNGFPVIETGVESAMMAALQDEDPIHAMAYGAAIQGVGTAAQQGWKHTPSFGAEKGLPKNLTKATFLAMLGTTMWQIGKSALPGGRDRILESQESAYNKVTGMMILGAMTAGAGFSRPSKTTLDELGLLVDTWHGARRSAVMSLITEWDNDDSGDMDIVMNALVNNSADFNPTALRRLTRAMENEDVSMPDTIESLMESDRDFRRLMMQLRERDTGMPDNLQNLIQSDQVRDLTMQLKGQQ